MLESLKISILAVQDYVMRRRSARGRTEEKKQCNVQGINEKALKRSKNSAVKRHQR
jgi:hypothetical protein